MTQQAETGRLKLYNEMMRTRDPQKLLDLARPVFGNPLILSNGGHLVLAITNEPEVTDPRWLEIFNTGGIGLGVVSNGDISEAHRTTMLSNRPVITECGGDRDGVDTLRKTIAVGDSILGYLDSPLYFQHPTEDDLEFFDFLSNLITLELQRNLGRVDLPDNMLEFFVYDLLEGHLKDRDLIRERLEYFGWDILGKGKAQVVSIRGRQKELAQDNTRFRRLLERFTTVFPLFKTFVYGSELKMICPVRESLELDGMGYGALLQLLEEEGLVAGVSRPLMILETIPDFHRQAEQAVEMGSRLHPEKTLHFYDDYAIYHALSLVEDQEELLQFCHSAIALLRDYDRKHETELLRSLRVYLTHDRSVGESAAALYIHRNTMNYRLSRINELTRLDMSDPDVFCHLLFSFYALDFRHYLSKAYGIRPKAEKD